MRKWNHSKYFSNELELVAAYVSFPIQLKMTFAHGRSQTFSKRAKFFWGEGEGEKHTMLKNTKDTIFVKKPPPDAHAFAVLSFFIKL
jgi:hypothetical protein